MSPNSKFSPRYVKIENQSLGQFSYFSQILHEFEMMSVLTKKAISYWASFGIFTGAVFNFLSEKKVFCSNWFPHKVGFEKRQVVDEANTVFFEKNIHFWTFFFVGTKQKSTSAQIFRVKFALNFFIENCTPDHFFHFFRQTRIFVDIDEFLCHGTGEGKKQICSVFFLVFQSIFKNCGKHLKHKETLRKMAISAMIDYSSLLS